MTRHSLINCQVNYANYQCSGGSKEEGESCQGRIYRECGKKRGGLGARKDFKPPERKPERILDRRSKNSAVMHTPCSADNGQAGLTGKELFLAG